MNSNRYFVGIDGCRSGWIGIYNFNDNFGTSGIIHKKKISEIISSFPSNSIFLIDMPIFLSNRKYARKCDVEAKKFLGKRRSSIFFAPCSQALRTKNYNDANNINKKITSLGLSKQSWNLFEKIKEIQKLNSKIKIFEGHPECSFTFYNKTEMDFTKSSAKGLFSRLKILYEIGFNVIELVDKLPSDIIANADDVIDAAILCWSAYRLKNNMAFEFPKTAELNSKKQKMSILY
tara:strand:- start:993 stop:1691 length:699 start_codon:yes stop_codon:yes gene_type:complete